MEFKEILDSFCDAELVDGLDFSDYLALWGLSHILI